MRFVIQRSKDGQYYWFVRGANGEIMATSETMRSKQSCKDAIAAIRAGAAGAQVLDMTE